LRVLCWAGFSSAEWFGTEFRQFAFIIFPRNGIPSCFLFRWRIRKGILRVFFYFCIHGKDFRVVFSSAEGNSESLLLFLFNGTEFLVVFSSPEGFGTEFGGFLFRWTVGILSEITICSIYSVFRGIFFFFRKFPTLPLTFSLVQLSKLLVIFHQYGVRGLRSTQVWYERYLLGVVYAVTRAVPMLEADHGWPWSTDYTVYGVPPSPPPLSRCFPFIGTGSRDRIHIFWRKWIILGLNKSHYWFFELLRWASDELSLSLSLFQAVKVKTYGTKYIFIGVPY
jgi:hypothetical protein